MSNAFCPESYNLLGVQIGFFALFLPFSLFGILYGYNISIRSFDHLFRGRYLTGLGLFLSGMALALACASVLPWVGYWLVDCP